MVEKGGSSYGNGLSPAHGATTDGQSSGYERNIIIQPQLVMILERKAEDEDEDEQRTRARIMMINIGHDDDL